MTLHQVSTTIPAKKPFDFGKSLMFLCTFAPTQHEQRIDNGVLTKAIRVSDQIVVFEASEIKDNGTHGINCTLFSDQALTKTISSIAEDRISFYLSLGDDINPFYQLGNNDPHFSAVINGLYGYHQVKFSSPFENACWAVLGQRIPMPVAQKMKQTLMNHFGNQLRVHDHTYQAFFDAKQLSSCSVKEINEMINNERKANYLHSVAEAFIDVDEQFLREGPYSDVKQWLLKINGIGEWSAQFVMIRGLGRMDEAPSDQALLKSFKKIYPADSSEDFQQVIQRYQGWQGYWGHYMRIYA